MSLLRKHVEEFAKDTSMHGVGKVILTKKPERRIAWVIVFTSAWVLFAYQLYCVLNNYFKYSKKTVTEYIPGGAPFPEITLCNMQSLDSFAVHKLQEACRGFEWDSNDSFVEFVGTNNNSLAQSIALISDIFRKQQQQLSEEHEARLYSRTTIAANLPREVIEEHGIREEEFVVRCTFRNRKCKFRTSFHPYYLKCFTFEPQNEKSTTEYDSLSEGIENGFSVTVFGGTKLLEGNFTRTFIPGVFEKGSPLSGSSGIRLVIHPPGTEPYPLTEGYDIPTGYLATLGIVPRRRIRLGQPHGQCAKRNRYKNDLLDRLNLTSDNDDDNEPYRKISCERTCMQEDVIKTCRCFDTSLPQAGDTLCNDNNNVCTHVDLKKEFEKPEYDTVESTEEELEEQEGEGGDDLGWSSVNSTQMPKCRSLPVSSRCFRGGDATTCYADVAQLLANIQCAENVTNRIMTDVRRLNECRCFAPCDEYRYDVSYSLSRWPSLGYENGAVYREIFDTEGFVSRFTDAESRALYNRYLEKERTSAMKDFAKINVYVTDSNVLQTVEEPAMVPTQLVSEIGGQLGLWIGVSVITISEVVETILTILTGACRKICRSLKGRIDEKTDDKGEQTSKTADL